MDIHMAHTHVNMIPAMATLLRSPEKDPKAITEAWPGSVECSRPAWSTRLLCTGLQLRNERDRGSIHVKVKLWRYNDAPIMEWITIPATLMCCRTT